MADFIPAPETVRVELLYDYGGQKVENRFHVQTLAAPSSSDLAAIASTVAAWWISDLKAVMPTNLSLQAVRVTDVSGADGEQLVYTTGLPSAGTGQSAALPNNVSIATKISTARRGRNSTGRWFWPGVAISWVTNNQISSQIQTLLNDALTSLKADLDAQDFLMCIVSYVLHKVPRIMAAVTPVTSFSTDTTVDSQRRRLPGRGR